MTINHSLTKPTDDLVTNMQCVELWRAVILQAILDLKNNGHKVMDKVNRIKAILWINLNRKDFIDVCQMANMNPQSVYNYKLKILQKTKEILPFMKIETRKLKDLIPSKYNPRKATKQQEKALLTTS